MKTIQEIDSEYDKLPEEDSDKIIEFFENNSDTLLSQNIGDISDIECIYTDYIVTLWEESRYSKVIEVTEKLENIKSVMNYSETDKDFKIDLIFHKSASLFNKKRLKESKQGFEMLVNIDPENEDFSDWYKDIKKRLLFRYISFIMFGSIGLAFLTLVIPEYFSVIIPKVYTNVLEGIFYLTFGFFIIEKFINKK